MVRESQPDMIDTTLDLYKRLPECVRSCVVDRYIGLDVMLDDIKVALIDPSHLEKVSFEHPDIYMAILAKNGTALQYVREDLQTPEMHRLAVSQNGDSLAYVRPDRHTPELCSLAIRQDSHAAIWIRNRSPDVCMYLVDHDGWILSYKDAEDCRNVVAYVSKDLMYFKWVLGRDYTEFCRGLY